jgi:hypothetical protein
MTERDAVQHATHAMLANPEMDIASSGINPETALVFQPSVGGFGQIRCSNDQIGESIGYSIQDFTGRGARGNWFFPG